MKLEDITTDDLVGELTRRISNESAWVKIDNLRHRAIADTVGKTIVRKVAEEFGIDERLIMSRERSPRVAKARAVAMAGLWMTGFSSVEVGKFFGRNHGTVLHAIKRTKVKRLNKN